jgi:TolB-like protein/DNA-binding winged helix-turn-helix (wHTH) protein/Flp pilus assembly protein TadD
MPSPSDAIGVVRFEPFELDARHGELRKHGVKLKLQEQPFQVLVRLLERPGELVSREELRSQLWPADTFVDFDHSLNAAVNRLRDCLGDVAERPRFIETVPRRGYRFVAPVRRIPTPAAPDETPAAPEETGSQTAAPDARGWRGGVETGAPDARGWRDGVETGVETRQSGSRRWTIAALAIVVAAIATVASWFGASWFGLRSAALGGSTPRERVMLAVLPLEDLSEDPRGTYFSDGLTEDIITRLGGLEPRRLGVLARTTVMQYKSTKKGIDQIGRELGVQYVLEGSVRRAADRVRVTAQLIQVRDQTHVWAKSFDRDVRDVLVLQSDLARAVVSEAAVHLSDSADDRLRTVESVNPAALDLYLRGREAWNRRTEEDTRAAIPVFEAAIRSEPTYARAYAGLADAHVVLAAWALGALPPGEGYSKARSEASKALELDDTLVEAHTTMGAIHAFYDWDAAGAQKEFRRAIELNPSYPTAHTWYAEHLATIGRFEEMLVESREAERLDPLSPVIVAGGAVRLSYAGRTDEAVARLRSVIRAHPDYLLGHAYLEDVLDGAGRYADAVREGETAVELSHGKSERLAALAYTYAALGRKKEALQALSQLKERARHTYVSAYSLALVYVGLGDVDGAFDSLEAAYREHSSWLSHLRLDHRLDRLRSDPRFRALQVRVGL